jgi:alkanesulfonate monooxygenase SsuD/methylene tetrahydromethanopterin reductase-like flavin-dependent oxidoreductase (luciferase family)
MISKSINSIAPGRIQVNLISGYIKEHEKNFGGIMGDINDDSDRIDRSNYLIEYVKMLNTMPGNQRKHSLDFYISTTNEYVFHEASKNNNKMILPYRDYKNGYWTVISEKSGQDVGNSFNVSDQNIMLALTPIIRKTEEELQMSEEYVKRPVWRDGETTGRVNDIEFFTFQQFDDFMKKLKSEGINQVLINGFPEKERENIINFIKYYKELGLSKNSLPHNDHKDHRIS